MTDKMQIRTLPVTEKFMAQKRLINDRGEFALIEDGRLFRHLGYFSLKKGKGYYRGGHYHRNKVEHFYVVRGKIKVRLVDLDSKEKSTVTLQEGHLAAIHPGCAHRFEAVEEAQVIEYYNSIYDPEDDVLYDDF